MTKGIKNLITRIKEWIIEHKLETFLLFLILFLGAYLRLYRISEYMTFLGDEGRDAIIVRRFLVNFDPILIGPGTSIGNMYLGPLYYYLIAPSLLLANLSPVGPSIFVAVMGVITILFIWFIIREWFPNFKRDELQGINYGALSGALLYAISPVVIVLSRSSWNPNVMPFFALLTIYSIWQTYKEHSFRWLLVLGASIAFVLNSHYLGLLLLIPVGFFWLLTLFELLKKKQEMNSFIKSSIISFVLFAILMSPLFIFDARHNWINLRAVNKFFTEREQTVSVIPWKAIPELPQISSEVTTRLLGGTDETIGRFLTVTLFVFSLLYFLTFFWGKRNQKKNNNFNKFELTKIILLIIWLVSGIVGLALYKQHIYDHYYGFMFPAPFILFGWIVQKTNFYKSRYLYQSNFISKLIILLLIGYLTFLNLSKSPLKNSPNRQMKRAQEVASLIAEKSKGEKLNLAVIADNNYEDGYQYFLEKNRLPVLDINPLDYNNTLAKQLFVVCELSHEKCDPVNSPKAGIANFGWSKVEESWQVSDVIVFKLVHAK